MMLIELVVNAKGILIPLSLFYCAAVISGLKKGIPVASIFALTIGFGIITLGVLGLTLGFNCPVFNWWDNLPC